MPVDVMRKPDDVMRKPNVEKLHWLRKLTVEKKLWQKMPDDMLRKLNVERMC
jgi:hypothetical protein